MALVEGSRRAVGRTAEQMKTRATSSGRRAWVLWLAVAAAVAFVLILGARAPDMFESILPFCLGAGLIIFRRSITSGCAYERLLNWAIIVGGVMLILMGALVLILSYLVSRLGAPAG